MDYSDEDVNVYKVLSKTKTAMYSSTPPSHAATPDSEEYLEGYIFRFFAKKANDKNAPIIEINENNFNMLRQNPFYVKVSMRWKISGPPTTLIRDGIEYEEGVSEYNYRQVTGANTIISGLYKKLHDLYQFYKPS
jgi:hypothetical protein